LGNPDRPIFEKPIVGTYNDHEKDRIDITKRFISVMEGYVKDYPHCWHFWDEHHETGRN
jgi:hypothetical protein